MHIKPKLLMPQALHRFGEFDQMWIWLCARSASHHVYHRLPSQVPILSHTPLVAASAFSSIGDDRQIFQGPSAIGLV